MTSPREPISTNASFSVPAVSSDSMSAGDSTIAASLDAHKIKPGEGAGGTGLTSTSATSTGVAYSVKTHVDARGESATKKPRLGSTGSDSRCKAQHYSASHSPEATTIHSPFLNLPLEILAEILLRTVSPADLLAVARTCKTLCTQLLSPGAAFIWRKMRITVGLPDPAEFRAEIVDVLGGQMIIGDITGVQCFVGREPAYAAFVFDGGLCEICGQSTNKMYDSYSVKLRVCSSPLCCNKLRGDFLYEYQVQYSGEWDLKRMVAWRIAPVLETSDILFSGTYYRLNVLWPAGLRVTRRSVIEAAIQQELELESVKEGKSRYNLRNSTKNKAPKGKKGPLRLTEGATLKLAFALARNNVWMQFCADLYQWQFHWLTTINRVKTQNESRSRQFAKDEEWNYSDMLKHTSFGRFLKDKLLERENIDDDDLERLRPIIARELHSFQQKRDRKIVLKLRQNNLTDIWKYYQKLLSQPETYPILPSFPVFLQLPAVQLLRSPELSNAKVSVKSAVDNKSFMSKMIKEQILKWVDGVKRDLLKTLVAKESTEGKGKGKGKEEWKWDKMAVTRNVPHPVLRLNAWWRCKVCDSVENDYEEDGCLDFYGVCRHQCKEKGGNKQKKGETSHAWNVNNFVMDEQACAVMTTCIERLDIADKATDEAWSRMERSWLCKSCDPPLVVHSKSLVGHSHRHAVPMDIELISDQAFLALKPKPTTFGLVQWMTHNRKHAKEWIGKVNYACQHCHNIRTHGEPSPVPATVASASNSADEEAEKEPSESKFNFNGLRCHLKSKHNIYNIRDEDFYCHTMVTDFPEALRERNWQLQLEVLLLTVTSTD